MQTPLYSHNLWTSPGAEGLHAPSRGHVRVKAVKELGTGYMSIHARGLLLLYLTE